MKIKRRRRKRFLKVNVKMRFFDKHLFFITLLLIILGLTFLASSSSAVSIARYGNAYAIFLKQLLWTIISFILMIYISIVDLEKLREKIPLIMSLTILLLIITLFMPKIQGVRRWIPLKVINLQTSEIAKIAVILYISHFIDKNYSKLNRIKFLIKPILLLLIILTLIAIQPDIGTPVIIFISVMATFFVSGIRVSYILLPIFTVMPLILVEILRHRYRIERIKTFLNPFFDPQGKGFQLSQSLAAIGSGWWFGKGPGNSIMKLRYLPESHTDFIFPIIAEEMGFIGVVIITALFLIFFIRTILIAKNCSSVFLSALSFASGFMITFQAFFNIAMSAGILPTKGLPLPFFSYGGSSIMATMILTGFILNSSLRRKRI